MAGLCAGENRQAENRICRRHGRRYHVKDTVQVNPAGGQSGSGQAGGICTVPTRFESYRHRRLLPFAAVYALVFINGATLVPFAPPTPLCGESLPEARASAAEGATTPGPASDSWRWLQYEQGKGATTEQPVIAAGPPPLVKNLRRSSISVQHGCCQHSPVGRIDDAPGLDPNFLQRALAANAADLSRLCRLLL